MKITIIWSTYIIDTVNIRFIVVFFFLEDVFAELSKFVWAMNFSWNDSFQDLTLNEEVVIFLQDIFHLHFVTDLLDYILVALERRHIFIPVFVISIGSQADFS